YGTVATLASGKHPVGTRVALTDRAMGVFLVQVGGSADGKGILSAGTSKTATLQNKTPINPEWVGAKAISGFDSIDYFDYALLNYKSVLFDGHYRISRDLDMDNVYSVVGVNIETSILEKTSTDGSTSE